jgi:hypothetical protein
VLIKCMHSLCQAFSRGNTLIPPVAAMQDVAWVVQVDVSSYAQSIRQFHNDIKLGYFISCALYSMIVIPVLAANYWCALPCTYVCH